MIEKLEDKVNDYAKKDALRERFRAEDIFRPYEEDGWAHLPSHDTWVSLDLEQQRKWKHQALILYKEYDNKFLCPFCKKEYSEKRAVRRHVGYVGMNPEHLTACNELKKILRKNPDYMTTEYDEKMIKVEKRFLHESSSSDLDIEQE